MSEWISVSENLPRAYVDTVLVARHEGEDIPSVMPAIHDGENFRALTIAGMIKYSSPTHWMPLPEPPKSGD